MSLFFKINLTIPPTIPIVEKVNLSMVTGNDPTILKFYNFAAVHGETLHVEIPRSYLTSDLGAESLFFWGVMNNWEWYFAGWCILVVIQMVVCMNDNEDIFKGE